MFPSESPAGPAPLAQMEASLPLGAMFNTLTCFKVLWS